MAGEQSRRGWSQENRVIGSVGAQHEDGKMEGGGEEQGGVELVELSAAV